MVARDGMYGHRRHVTAAVVRPSGGFRAATGPVDAEAQRYCPLERGC